MYLFPASPASSLSSTMSDNPDKHINICKLFPSLFALIGISQDASYEVVWLVGCINELVICVAITYVQYASTTAVDRILTAIRPAAHAHLSDQEWPCSCDSLTISIITSSVDQVVNIVQLIHRSYRQKIAQFRLTFMFINIASLQQIAVDEIEDSFNELTYSTVVSYLYNGGTESNSSVLLD
jgi:hypothetical protein